RAFGSASANGEAGAFGGQSAEKIVAAAATHNDDFSRLHARVAAKLFERAGVRSGEAVEDQRGHAHSSYRAFIEGVVAMRPQLRIDPRWHVAYKSELGIADVEKSGRLGLERRAADQIVDREGCTGGLPRVHTLLQEPHAVNGFVEADAIADRAEIGEVVGERGGRIARRGQERTDEGPCAR